MTVCVFRSTRAVIEAERVLRDAGIPIRVIPVPRSVSPACGMALEIGPDVLDGALAVLRGESIDFARYDKDDVVL